MPEAIFREPYCIFGIIVILKHKPRSYSNESSDLKTFISKISLNLPPFIAHYFFNDWTINDFQFSGTFGWKTPLYHNGTAIKRHGRNSNLVSEREAVFPPHTVSWNFFQTVWFSFLLTSLPCIQILGVSPCRFKHNFTLFSSDGASTEKLFSVILKTDQYDLEVYLLFSL